MKINLDSNNYIELVRHSSEKKDLLLIFPGGAYVHTSEREANPVYQALGDLDMHFAIFYYRETHLLYPKIKEEGQKAIEALKSLEFVNHVFVMGFSAGGHYAAMLSCAYPQLIKGTLLLYPVITSNNAFWHQGSFINLTQNISNKALMLEVSLEHQVHPKMAPVFLMHTKDDEAVPVENSLLFMEALRKHQVEVELHLFPKGRHGVSTATESVAFNDMDTSEFMSLYGYLNAWVYLAKTFIRRNQ